MKLLLIMFTSCTLILLSSACTPKDQDGVKGAFGGGGPTSDGGGGNGIDGKPFESFRVDVHSLEAFKTLIDPNFSVSASSYNGKVLDFYWSRIPFFMSPKPLKLLPAEKIGVIGIDAEFDQLAIQNNLGEVWIDKEKYDKMKMDDQAQLLVHEFAMSLAVLKGQASEIGESLHAQLCHETRSTAFSYGSSAEIWFTAGCDKVVQDAPEKKASFNAGNLKAEYSSIRDFAKAFFKISTAPATDFFSFDVKGVEGCERLSRTSALVQQFFVFGMKDFFFERNCQEHRIPVMAQARSIFDLKQRQAHQSLKCTVSGNGMPPEESPCHVDLVDDGCVDQKDMSKCYLQLFLSEKEGKEKELRMTFSDQITLTRIFDLSNPSIDIISLSVNFPKEGLQVTTSAQAKAPEDFDM